MKKPIAKLAATGVLTLAALAGTAATAGAATPSSVSSTSVSPQWSGAYGPFPTSGICEQFVWDHDEWGVWDCESPDYGHTWYAYVP